MSRSEVWERQGLEIREAGGGWGGRVLTEWCCDWLMYFSELLEGKTGLLIYFCVSCTVFCYICLENKVDCLSWLARMLSSKSLPCRYHDFFSCPYVGLKTLWNRHRITPCFCLTSSASCLASVSAWVYSDEISHEILTSSCYPPPLSPDSGEFPLLKGQLLQGTVPRAYSVSVRVLRCL